MPAYVFSLLRIMRSFGPYNLHRNCIRQQWPATATVFFVLLTMASGCVSKQVQDVPSPDIRGVVTGIIPANDQMRSRSVIAFLRIEGKRDSAVRYDRADVAITDTTQMYQRHGSDMKPAGFDAVHEGTEVEAYFIGPVLERYPVHATAGKLIIVK